MRSLVPAILMGAVACAASADEIWQSEMGWIAYEAEENGAAIFSFTNLDAYGAILVIPGLAGNYDNRGVHEAFWIGEGAGDCGAFMSLPGGAPSAQWGRALVSFDQPAFPTSFTLSLGYCFEPLSYSIRAVAE